jgi:hypothetical protein
MRQSPASRIITNTLDAMSAYIAIGAGVPLILG